MLGLSASFKSDTQTANCFLIPLVIFEWASGEKKYISTNDITFDGNSYIPVLKTQPSLTESIGIQSKKYKISSVTLKVSNYKYSDIYFSDSLTDSQGDYLIGGFCNIYYKSQSNETIDDCTKIYTGIVRDISISSSYVSIKLEDLSQELFYKDIPRKKLSGGKHIMGEYRNAPYPMVYGLVDKSPCIIGDRSIVDADYHQSIQVIAEAETGVEILDNLEQLHPSLINHAVIEGTEGNDTFSVPRSYVMFFSDGKYASINRETYDSNGEIGAESYDEDSDTYDSNILLGDQTNSPHGEWVGGVEGEYVPGSNPNIILLKGLTSPSGRTNLIARNMAECFYISSIKDIKNWSDDDEYRVSLDTWIHNPAILPFNGSTLIGYNSDPDFIPPGDTDQQWSNHTYWVIRHTLNMEEPPSKVQYSLRTRLVQGYLSGSVTFDTLSVEHPDIVQCEFGYTGYAESSSLDIGYSITRSTQLFGDGSPHNNIGDVGGLTDGEFYDNNHGLVELNVPYIFNQYSYDLIRMPGENFSYPTIETNSWIFRMKCYQWDTTEVQVSLAGVSQLDIDLKVINLYHAEDILDKPLFCSINGRFGINNNLTPPSIIIDIIQSEILDGGTLDYDIDEYNVAINAHVGWEYAFTVSKRKNAKDLISSIAKENKSFIYVNNWGEFSFITALDKYEIDSYGEEISFVGMDTKGYFIDRDDVLKFKIKRTRLRDVKTKLELLYHYDYGHKSYLKTTADNDVSQTAKDIFPEYLNTYYGIEEEQGGDPIELDYIRHDETANKLQKYLLAWHCNQHNLISFRLPLSYLSHEIGDVIAFKELIEGRKAYGEDYSFNNRVFSAPEEQIVIRNGQEIHPFFMITKTKKTLDYVDIEAIQLHNLTNIETDAINRSPTAVISSFTLEDDGLGTPNNVFAWTNTNILINVQLDGTGSTDPDGDPLNYEWLRDPYGSWSPEGGVNGETVAFNSSASADLPAPGEIVEHSFRLKVDDGEYSHTSNPVRIYVVNGEGLPPGESWTSTVEYINGWNIVGLSANVQDNSVGVIFPDHTSGTLYDYNETYVQQSELIPGRGYWLYFEDAGSSTYLGAGITQMTLTLNEGWNLISGISETVSMASLNDPEGIVIPGSLYGFDGQYQYSSVIEPGKGYWIRCYESGSITLGI